MSDERFYRHFMKRYIEVKGITREKGKKREFLRGNRRVIRWLNESSQSVANRRSCTFTRFASLERRVAGHKSLSLRASLSRTGQVTSEVNRGRRNVIKSVQLRLT